MPEQKYSLPISYFGGINANDAADELLHRSHVFQDGQYVQQSPMETPDATNIDFGSQGIKKRLGSSQRDSLVSIAHADEILLKGIEWQNPTSTGTQGARIQILVGKKSIYTNQSGSWAQVKTSTGGTYTHASDVTKVSFAMIDGHLFIGLDGANNYIQVYKEGTDLDPEMKENNLYEEAHTATTHTITGTWPKACFAICALHGRLVMSNGDILVQWTPQAETEGSGIWDLGGDNYGYYHASGYVRTLIPFAPRYTDSIDELLYIGTNNGLEVTTGLGGLTGDSVSDIDRLITGGGDKLVRIEGTRAPLNHQSYCRIQNWVIYLSDDKNIYAINGTTVIDLGRRLKNPEGNGPLDGMDVDDSEVNAFGFYNADREQAYFHFNTDSNTKNDRCIMLDFKYGEPVMGESKITFERKVRPMMWEIKDAIANDWFSHIYQIQGATVGIRYGNNNEITYTLFGNGDDYANTSIPVEGEWYTPILTVGAEWVNKQWVTLHVRGIIEGDWTVTIDVYKNRGTGSVLSTTYSQATGDGVYGSGLYGTDPYANQEVVIGSADIKQYAEALQWKLSNTGSLQPFLVTSMATVYKIGTEKR